MQRRLFLFAALAAALLIFTGADCHGLPGIPRDPWPPVGPESTWTGVPTVYEAVTTISKGSIRYVVAWGDTTDTTVGAYASGETATVSHVWTAAGNFPVKVLAFNAAWPEKVSSWSSPAKSVRVIANDRPVVDWFRAPPVGIRDIEGFFELKGYDPAGDSIRFHVDWGDNADTTTSFDASPCSTVVSHVYTSLGTFTAIAEAEDIHGVYSAPESVSIVVGTAGGVMWYWRGIDPEYEGSPFTTSAFVASDGAEERLFIACRSDLRFYSIRTSDRKGEKTAMTLEPENIFTGNLAFCEATQHIIVGSDEGLLYALNIDGLGRAWTYPDSWGIESLSGFLWGAPAIRDNRLYVPREDDSLYYIIDSVDHAVRMATFTPHTGFVDAPVIDAQGNVYFGTDSGYLYKVGPELDTVFWRTRLLAHGEVHGPAIGSDGTIYCASDSFRVYAIDAATGGVKQGWPLTLDGDVTRLAIGRSAIFVGSSLGKVYSIDPATGSINWEKQLTLTAGFNTSPVVAADGYVYFQDDDDVLYCLNQSDGLVIWYCDCPRWLPRSGSSPHRPRKSGLNDYPPNPTMTVGGNIIVAGDDAVYCVAGYPERPLDPLAPWPKWQHDLYNTGYVNGGK